MNNVNLQSQLGWKVLLQYALPFLPFGVYVLVSLDLLPGGILPVLWLVTLAALTGWGLWKLWHGVTKKDGRELASGITPLALVSLVLLQNYDLVNSSSFFFLILSAVGVSWLVEKVLLKVWER